MQKAYTQLALSSAASRGGGSPRPACHPVSLAPMGGAADDPDIRPTVFHRHELFCSLWRILRADIFNGGGPRVCRRGDAVVQPVQHRGREKGADRACLHLDASCFIEREEVCRSAKDLTLA